MRSKRLKIKNIKFYISITRENKQKIWGMNLWLNLSLKGQQ
jgi:hypothetical protein